MKKQLLRIGLIACIALFTSCQVEESISPEFPAEANKPNVASQQNYFGYSIRGEEYSDYFFKEIYVSKSSAIISLNISNYSRGSVQIHIIDSESGTSLYSNALTGNISFNNDFSTTSSETIIELTFYEFTGMFSCALNGN